ncbi:MAG: hypothetical protein JNL42_11775 [Anaerolineae bacterium]|nr:hypothetical protein [Anaerolineae bacterium]
MADINTANSNGQADTINLAANCTYTLTGFLPNITSPITFNGGGTAILDGANLFSFFSVTDPISLTIDGVTLRNGNIGAGIGGAVAFRGTTLTIINSSFQNNTGVNGGALYIWNNTTVEIRGSTFQGNQAVGTGNASGGAIANYGAMTITNSTFTGNSAVFGSAIANLAGSTATITNSTISDNVNNAGVFNFATMVINNSIVANNPANCQNLATITVHNTLIEGGGCSITNGVDGNLIDDPALGALTGSPAYFPITAGSIAYNAGNNSLVPGGITTDQAGNSRIRGGTVDMGSFEAVPPVVSLSKSSMTVSEGSDDTFLVERNVLVAAPLTVNLTVTQGANTTAGDYTLSGAGISGQVGSVTVVIPANEFNTTVLLDALFDGNSAEPDNTLTIALASGGYSLGATTTMTATIPANGTQVTTLTDDTTSEGTLRQAVVNANADPASDSIDFTVGGTIHLTTALPPLANAGALTINGGGAVTVSGDDSIRVFLIDSGANVTINDLTMTDGLASAGGGLQNSGTLTINHSTVSSSIADTTGGGIYNLGTLTLNASVVVGNGTGVVNGASGGIYSAGPLTLINSTISGNTAGTGGGAGLFTTSTVTLTNSTVGGNTTTGIGGGINHHGGVITLNNSMIAGNTAIDGSGIFNDGNLNLNNSIVADNTGLQCSGDFALSASHSLVEGGGCGIADGVNGNKTGDPALGTFTGSPGYFPLNAGSIAIDAGDNALIPVGVTFDQAGNNRIRGGIVDMGSFEAQSTIVEVSLSPASQNVSEGATANITLTRTGSTAGTLPVNFTITGTASAGDYTLTVGGSPVGGSSVTIPAGSASVIVQVNIVDDIFAETGETVVFTIAAGADYTTLAPFVSTTGIFSNDLIVTNLNDFTGGASASAREGTLRQAIANASSFGTNDIIDFAVSGTITLTGGSLTALNNGTLIIDGNREIVVDAGGASRVFSIDTNATVTLQGLTVQGGSATSGGGIENNGTLTLVETTVNNNTASLGGGGIVNNSGRTLTLINSTVSGNTAGTSGGGILNIAGTVTLYDSTVAGNSGTTGAGGIQSSGTLNLNNSILADSLSNADCGGTVATANFSLVEDGGCGVVNGVNGNKTGDPKLGALTGSPPVHPLLITSPAINTGSNALIPGSVQIDQVGNTRILDTTVDMGAVESVSATLTVTLTLQSRPPTPNSAYVTTVHVQIRKPGSATALLSLDIASNTSGQFVIPNLNAASYDLWIKGTHTLAVVQTKALAGGSNSLTTAVLKEGDANDSNSVTIGDFSILAGAFGTTSGNAGYDARADFNGSGTITITDFSLLAANFTQSGAP